jgi:ribose transport system substrate-binding protein
MRAFRNAFARLSLEESAVSIRALIAASLSVIALAGCSRSTPAGAPAGGKAATGGATESGKRFKIAMIPKGSQTSFWNSVKAGAEQARDEFDVELIWKGPAVDNDRTLQKQLVQQFTSGGVDALLLAATDKTALVPDVHTATARGIPVLIFDSSIEGEPGKDFVSYVATDNRAAGRLGGQHVMDLVGKGGKVILFRHMEGHESTGNREEGALEEFKAAGGEILAEDRYSGENAAEAQKTALNMIDVIREAAGIFCPNQSSSEGLLLALRQHNLAGKIKVVAFDSSPLLTQALRDGEIAAIVSQDPGRMGYLSVKMMVEHLQGKPIEPLVNTDVHLVTRDNMDDPKISPLLQK